MNLNSIKNVLTSKASRQILHLQKHSPTILFGAGVVGVVATAVMASRATLKLDDVLEQHAKTLVNINITNHEDYSDDDRQQDKIKLYVRTAMNITKLYGPAVIIGGATIACLTGSHHVLSQRNAGLMAAYAALEKGFDQYRARVLADVGEDKDREYRYGVTEHTVVEKTEKGEKKTVVRKAEGKPSIYSKFFDEYSTSWSREPMYNLMFLKAQQNYANDRLRAKGHLLLNDVYDSLGLDRTKEGCVVGWTMGYDGDDYVDFGIFDRKMEPRHLDFFTGREEAILLDFNVDGVVYDKI